MTKYRMMITVVRKYEDAEIRSTNTYVSYCGCMADALEKAGRYAMYQLGEEKADYIKHISVTACPEEGNDEQAS